MNQLNTLVFLCFAILSVQVASASASKVDCDRYLRDDRDGRPRTPAELCDRKFTIHLGERTVNVPWEYWTPRPWSNEVVNNIKARGTLRAQFWIPSGNAPQLDAFYTSPAQFRPEDERAAPLEDWGSVVRFTDVRAHVNGHPVIDASYMIESARRFHGKSPLIERVGNIYSISRRESTAPRRLWFYEDEDTAVFINCMSDTPDGACIGRFTMHDIDLSGLFWTPRRSIGNHKEVFMTFRDLISAWSI